MPGIFYVSYVTLWLLMIVQGILLLLVYRHFGLMLMGKLEGVERDGLPVGARVAPVRGVTEEGDVVEWMPKPSRLHLVAFVSADCNHCAQVLPSIAQLGDERADIDITLLTRGSREAAAQLSKKIGTSTSVVCLADPAGSAYEGFRVRVTPFAFLIGTEGRVRAKGLCDNVEKLQGILSAAKTSGGNSTELEGLPIHVVPPAGSK